MARLLVLAHHPTRAAGEVVEVMPDDHVWSELERRQFACVDVPDLTVEEARAKYTKSGVPDEARDAARAADAELSRAINRGNRTEIDQAKANAVAMQAVIAPQAWPTRTHRLDVAVIPQAVRDKVRATWDALDAVRETAREAAHVAVVAEVERREGRTLTTEEKAVRTHERIARIATDWAAAKARGATKQTLGSIDEFQDAINAASRVGRKAIEDPILAALEVPEIVTLDAKTLDGAAVEVKP